MPLLDELLELDEELLELELDELLLDELDEELDELELDELELDEEELEDESKVSPPHPIKEAHNTTHKGDQRI